MWRSREQALDANSGLAIATGDGPCCEIGVDIMFT
jgi:hypothetical protein